MKIVQGTARKDRLNPNEPELEPGVPDVIDEIAKDPIAFDEWNRLVRYYGSAGVLVELDRGIMVIYCSQYAKYIRYLRGEEPDYKAFDLSQLYKAESKLGLSPADRANVSGKGKDKKSKWGAGLDA